MTGQRTWVCTLDGDAVAVDQIVRYKAVTGTATGRAVIEAFASDGRSPVRLGPFVSAPQALDFARRHFGPVVDPAGTVRANAAAVVLTIDVDAEAWAEHL